jgi:hypothetical protein
MAHHELDNIIDSIAKCKEDLAVANKRLRAAHDDVEYEYNKLIEELCLEEKALDDRMDVLRKKTESATEKYGNKTASGDDNLEINAGGKVIVVGRRSILTHRTAGTRFEALFSGRWDKTLQRDRHGRIFLDVNSDCFQAIVTYLSESSILPEDKYPELPHIDDEHVHILWQQLVHFGLSGKVMRPRAQVPPKSTIIPIDGVLATNFLQWVNANKMLGYFSLRYNSKRDGLSSTSIGVRCNKKGSYIFIMQANVILSDTSWSDDDFRIYWKKRTIIGKYPESDSFFSKNLKDQYDKLPAELSKFKVLQEEKVHKGKSSVEQKYSFSISQLEVFEVCGSSVETKGATESPPVQRVPATRFTEDINNAINFKQVCLPQTELKVRTLENSFNEEEPFIDAFASGDAKDVITLNVRGTMMTTKRSTLRTFEQSVLAQQFDDSKWTEQGYTSLQVKRWSADDVCNWVNTIDGIEENVGSIFKKHAITGCELLALNIDGLKMMGIERVGTVCLLQQEIEALVKATQDVVSLIDHCPYCFGKILDFLRLKQLHAQGFAKDEPALPEVPKSQKDRFEKVVNFYFPGDAAKLILGG